MEKITFPTVLEARKVAQCYKVQECDATMLNDIPNAGYKNKIVIFY